MAMLPDDFKDLTKYLDGIPERLRSSGAFVAYEERLEFLEKELGRPKKWRDYYDRSQAIAHLADALSRGENISAKLQSLQLTESEFITDLDMDQEQTALMLNLYRLAAKAAEDAIDALDPSKQKTLGITAINAASLWLKARDFRETQRVCDFWIEKAEAGEFPDFAVIELKNVIKNIQSNRKD